MGKRITINPDWPEYARLTFLPAVKKGNMLFIRGQNAVRPDPAVGKPVVEGDVATQTEVIYEKIEAILKAAGATLDDIVMTTDYVLTWEDYTKTADIRRRHFGDNFPAATGVLVKGFVQGALIEIDAVAVLN